MVLKKETWQRQSLATNSILDIFWHRGIVTYRVKAMKQ
jgi:hypothetical protein